MSINKTLSSGLMGLSTFVETNAKNNQLESMTRLNQINSEIADRNAIQSLRQGEMDKDKYKKNLQSQKAILRQGVASSGVTVGKGTAGVLEDEIGELGEQDAQAILQNAFEKSQAFKQQATQNRNQARINRSQKATGLGMGLSVLGSIL